MNTYSLDLVSCMSAFSKMIMNLLQNCLPIVYLEIDMERYRIRGT